MFGISRRVFGFLAVATLGCLITGTLVRGDDTPATSPSTDTGTITGVVSGPNGPVSGATVRLMAPSKHHKKSATNTDTPANGQTPDQGSGTPGDQPAPKPHKGGKALQTATTGADGSYTFSNVAPGDYIVVAMLEGVGVGHEKATVTAGASTTANITLAAKKPKANQ